MRKFYVISMVVMLLLAAFLVIIPMSETAQAATLTVGSDQSYTTIQGAIDAASAGDIIRVHDGVYNEHLTISVPLTIIGNGTDETQLITDSTSPGITIASDYVNVSNMAISTRAAPAVPSTVFLSTRESATRGSRTSGYSTTTTASGPTAALRAWWTTLSSTSAR
jgi:pectin methylesterase-like acyl-CoA thioesterase